MSSGDGPPSFSSAGIKSFDQEQLQVGATVDAQAYGVQNNQSWSNVRSVDNMMAAFQIQPTGDTYDQLPSGQGNSYNQLQDGIAYRGLGQTAGIVDGDKAPSFTAIGHGQGNSHNQDGTFNREVRHSYGYGAAGQAPSVDVMGRDVFSHPSGGGDLYNDGQPPSLNDVARREHSQNGAPSTDNQTPPDAQEFVGMSLVGKNFRKFYPNAYYKEKDEN